MNGVQETCRISSSRPTYEQWESQSWGGGEKEKEEAERILEEIWSKIS